MKHNLQHNSIGKKIRLISLLFLLVATLPAVAQKYPERSLVRKGNRAFDKGKYDRSIDRYREAVERVPGTWEATYNLGNALYRSEQYDKAAEALRQAAADSLRTPEERADAFYNLADVQYRQQKLPEALESLKSSLRLNPADEDAKFNYTLIKRQMQQQEQEQEQNQDQDQQQQDQQNQQQQGEPEQNQENEQDKQDDQSEQQEENQPEQQQAEAQPREGNLSEQELEQMLEAIQAQEDETQEKLKEKRGVLIRGNKNW